MNIIPRDVLYNIMLAGIGHTCLSKCRSEIIQARSTQKGNLNFKENCEKLADVLISHFKNDQLISDAEAPEIKNYFLRRIKKATSKHTTVFESIENLIQKMVTKKLSSPNEYARKLLYKSMNNPQAQNGFAYCRDVIGIARKSYNSAYHNKQCDDLANGIIVQLLRHSLIPKEKAPNVKNYLLDKAKKQGASTQQPFESLQKLIGKLKSKTMLSPSQKSRAGDLSFCIKKEVEMANVFLKQAIQALLDNTDLVALKEELDQGLWNTLHPFLAPQAFSYPPNSSDPMIASIEAGISFLSMVETFIQRASEKSEQSGRREGKNFFANLGKFFTHFAPYYNSIWADVDKLAALRQVNPSGQSPISVKFCNAFLKAGGVPEISELPKEPKLLPPFTFTSATNKMRYQPPIKPIPLVVTPSASTPNPAPSVVTPVATPSVPTVKPAPSVVIPSDSTTKPIPSIFVPSEPAPKPPTPAFRPPAPKEVSEKKEVASKEDAKLPEKEAEAIKSPPPPREEPARENRLIAFIKRPFIWIISFFRWLFNV